MTGYVRRIVPPVVSSVLVLLLVSACTGGTAAPAPDLGATEAAIRAEVVATVTAEAPVATDTPEPTETPEPAAAGAPAATPTPEPTQADDERAKAFHWTEYNYDIQILPDGDMLFRVDMTFSFDSGTFSQGYYSFDMDRLTDVRDVEVLEASQPYERVDSEQVGGYQVTVDDQFEVLWWFPLSSQMERTFTLRYRVVGGLRIYDEGDQLYWNFYAGDRSGRVDSGTITVHLPAEVPLQSLHVAISPVDIAVFQTDERSVQAQVTALKGHQPVVLRVQFPHGMVEAQPAPWQSRQDSQ